MNDFKYFSRCNGCEIFKLRSVLFCCVNRESCLSAGMLFLLCITEGQCHFCAEYMCVTASEIYFN